ncbi:MAG: hypothetical protein LQ338_005681 [Usnochroma carphineum]|nr:MAG: hypothetical protein LQ338_005681 [Usnochroma carphineum]
MDFPDDAYTDPQKLFQAISAGNPNLPTPVFLSFQEVKRTAKQYSSDIFTAQRVIASALDRYEEALIKRWLKKTTTQRQKILTTASPGIPPTHRPDFWAIRKESHAQTRQESRYRDYWLLPSLNLEDLSKPRNLLLLLRSRARNPPGVFVNADANSVHVGHVAQALMPPYLSGYTMLLNGQYTQDAYGRMISCDENHEAFDMMSRGTGLQPGEGLQVMEIQQRKMQFLQRCIELTLQDLPLKDPGIPKQLAPADDSFASTGSQWPSLTQEIEEAPYTVPDPFDMARLCTFAVAKRNEAEDHIWSLREDPSDFQEAVMEWSDHRQERILTASGKAHPVLRQDVFWERVLSNVVVNAYTDFVMWDLISKEIDLLAKMKAPQPNHTRANQELPEDFSQALAHFEHLVEQLTKGPIGNWKVGMVASPPLRQHYVREPQDPHSTRIRVTTKDSSRKKTDHLLWLLEVFLQEDQLFLCGLENVCDELEREIRSNKASRERISPYIANLISELSVLGEIKRQIGLMTPGPRMIEVIGEDDKKAEFSRKIKLFSEVYQALTSMGNSLAATGAPLSKFNYPSNRRRTLATTQMMQRAEKNLDAFWSQIDDRCQKITGKTVHEMLDGILKDRPLQRTADWIESDSKPRYGEENSELDTTSSQLAALELQNRTEGTVITTPLAQEKHKPKTRGAPYMPLSTTAQDSNTSTSTKDGVTRIFEVSKRGLKVFTTLFYTPTGEEPPGEIPWSEFLSAMASVGFSIKKLDGSAWIFAPVDDEWKQSIIFHEPHPGSKIPFQVARRFGRRLWRTYGWSSDNFRRA